MSLLFTSSTPTFSGNVLHVATKCWQWPFKKLPVDQILLNLTFSPFILLTSCPALSKIFLCLRPVSVWQLPALLSFSPPNELFHWAPAAPAAPAALKKNHILGVPFASAEIGGGTGGRGAVGSYQVNSCANPASGASYSVSHNHPVTVVVVGIQSSGLPDPLKQNLRDEGLDIGILKSAPGHSDLQAKFKLLPYIRVASQKACFGDFWSHQYINTSLRMKGYLEWGHWLRS